VLEKKRASFVGMAAPTLRIQSFLLNHAMALGSMRIMAAGTGYFSFNDRVM
jgi:hypothetical protein